MEKKQQKTNKQTNKQTNKDKSKASIIRAQDKLWHFARWEYLLKK